MYSTRKCQKQRQAKTNVGSQNWVTTSNPINPFTCMQKPASEHTEHDSTQSCHTSHTAGKYLPLKIHRRQYTNLITHHATSKTKSSEATLSLFLSKGCLEKE